MSRTVDDGPVGPEALLALLGAFRARIDADRSLALRRRMRRRFALLLSAAALVVALVVLNVLAWSGRLGGLG